VGATPGQFTALRAARRADLIGDEFIRKRLLLYTIVAVLAVVFTQVPRQVQDTRPQEHLNKSETVAPAKADTPKATPTVEQPAVEETAPQPQVKTEVVNTQPAPAGSCEEAIAAVWPASLQSGARLVSTKESSMISDRIGPLKADGTVGYNYNGSRDYGCFQINDQAHPDFFANGDWRDPTYNAQYALKIYNERGNWTAWYAVRGILW
jgi:hypothetical protein